MMTVPQKTRYHKKSSFLPNFGCAVSSWLAYWKTKYVSMTMPSCGLDRKKLVTMRQIWGGRRKSSR